MSGPILGAPADPNAVPPTTATGYYAFLRSYMGIPVDALPDNSFWIPVTYALSLDVVNIFLSLSPQVSVIVPPQPPGYPSQYAYAVYNYAADRMVNFAQDDPDNPYNYPGVVPPTPYFQYLRSKFGLDSFVSGVITYAADVTTSASYAVPDWMKDMSMADLQTLKTPWGRAYMAIASQYGPTIVDIT
jgi:hypothetical protein